MELPKAFERQMEDILEGDYPAFLSALDEDPVISLRLNHRKPGAQFPEASPIPWCENGCYLDERPRFIRDPYIHAGAYYVQEASSMLVAQCLDYQEDQIVLDLCASPGGKSTLLLDRLSQGSLLVSNELVRNRAQVLAENVSRWGYANCIVTNSHPREYARLQHVFDAILVDAPCSGEGMFRKDPAVIGHWSNKMVHHCAERQKDIMRMLMHALKPGGRLIYSTCTYNRQENEEIVKWVLNHDKGAFKIVEVEVPEDWGLTPGDTEGFPEEMRFTYHCYPHKVRGEGFFFACLEKVRPVRGGYDPKTAERAIQRKKDKRKGRNRFRDEEKGGPRPVQNFSNKDFALAAEYLQNPEDFHLFQKGENVYALPCEQQEAYEKWASQLNVIRPGVCLGKIKKNRFIPDHDLALSGLSSRKIPVLELTYEQSLKYLKRMDPGVETGDARDWALVAYQGQVLGWVRILESRVNNHLPRNWKIRADLSDVIGS